MSIRPEDAEQTYQNLKDFLLGATGNRDRMWHGYQHSVENLTHVCNQLDHAMSWAAMLKGKNWREFSKYARFGPIGMSKFVVKTSSYDENLAVLHTWVGHFIEWLENPLFELAGIIDDENDLGNIG